MDHFEIDADMSEEERQRMQQAISVLKAAVHTLSGRLGVCPVCLIYALADLTAEAEEAGLLRHDEETEH